MATIKAKLAAHLHSPAVLPLAEELVAVTELEPAGKDIGKFIGKCINRDGSIALYPKVTWWRQSVAQVPATIDGVFKYLCEARTRNICLIRGAPAKLERQPTRRHLAYKVHRGVDRGDHGFVDEPTRLFFLDVDGFPANWIEDPEHALKALVEQLGEPFASASVVWFFSATHGLKRDTNKRWTGGISDGGMRVRLAFLTTRALDEAEALKLTALAQAGVSAVDSSISRTVQPNYIKRPLWLERPERDPLGEIATIGLVRGANEYLAVPDDLPHKVRWAKAQGQGGVVVQHPDAESAVRGIGSDGHVRSHMTSAVVHLLRANPTPEKADRYAHSINIVEKLREMIEQHREEIENNLAPHGRGWGDVAQYLPDNMVEWSIYVLDNPLDDHPGGRNRKTVKLVKAEEAAPPQCDEIRKRVRNEIRERVEDTIKHFCGVPAEHRGWEWGCEWLPEEEEPVMALTSDGEWVVVPAGWLELPEAESPKAELVVAPTGSGKSMWMRYAAVESKKTVAVLVPRHRLGDEQVKLLREEHPEVKAAVWRGRGALDPADPGGKEKMCLRSEEAELVQEAGLDVEESLCKQKSRGKEPVTCKFYSTCGYQEQKTVDADIWFAAHELLTQRKPKALGKVDLVMIDESPLDAFGFEAVLPLKLLNTVDENNKQLTKGRRGLYEILSGLFVGQEELGRFAKKHDLTQLAKWEEEKIIRPEITPDMTKKEVRQELKKAAGNIAARGRAMLFRKVKDNAQHKQPARIEVKGDEVRMVGIRPVGVGWREEAPTLICDATGDPKLLRAVWPGLVCEEEDSWQQLPHPENVRFFQVVDRSFSKSAVAVEGNDLEERARAARRMYAALLEKATTYGGAPVAAVVYKSTKEWVRKNCFVPDWLTLTHHGDVTGTNSLKDVRALFVVGRLLPQAEAVTRQAEALFGGERIPEREYQKDWSRFPIIRDEVGNTHCEVEAWEHPDARAERLRRQVTEASLIQAVGRARAGNRDEEGGALDIHLWTDVPLPELGPVEPVLWDDIKVGLDGLMLASGGVWLELATDAAKAYEGLFTADGLRDARKARTGGVFTNLLAIRYQRAGAGQRPSRAVAFADVGDPRAWLEGRLGPLAWCEIEGEGAEQERRDRETLQAHLGGFTDHKVRSVDVCAILNVQGAAATQELFQRAAEAMKQLGWRRPNKAGTVRIDGQVVKGFVIGDGTIAVNACV